MQAPCPDPDEIKAGKAYTKVMGYDPITYHTDHKISMVVDAINKGIPDLADVLQDLEANIRDVIHSEIREMKKEVIATTIFDAVITSATDISIDINELKRIIEDTLSITDVIDNPEDEEDAYEILMDEDEEDDIIYDEDEDDDFDDED